MIAITSANAQSPDQTNNNITLNWLHLGLNKLVCYPMNQVTCGREKTLYVPYLIGWDRNHVTRHNRKKMYPWEIWNGRHDVTHMVLFFFIKQRVVFGRKSNTLPARLKGKCLILWFGHQNYNWCRNMNSRSHTWLFSNKTFNGWI